MATRTWNMTETEFSNTERGIPTPLYAAVGCKCGWMTERTVASREAAEVLAEQHENKGWRRPYQHDTWTTVRAAA